MRNTDKTLHSNIQDCKGSTARINQNKKKLNDKRKLEGQATKLRKGMTISEQKEENNKSFIKSYDISRGLLTHIEERLRRKEKVENGQLALTQTRKFSTRKVSQMKKKIRFISHLQLG